MTIVSARVEDPATGSQWWRMAQQKDDKSYHGDSLPRGSAISYSCFARRTMLAARAA
jgi:hypothetical protein